MPELHLFAGDAVEPSPTMPDVAAIDKDSDTYPLKCMFWRHRPDGAVLHRNPLLDSSLGLS
eukprot:15480421-Alexandrium_andersonii.AAC.1